MTTYAYEIKPRRSEVGGGWQLRLLQDGNEVGGGVFPVDQEAERRSGIEWFNALTEDERASWLAKAESARPEDAWGAYLTDAAFLDAHAEGESWVAARQ
ncbi:hypothetical protein [Cupriavidus nantongensis]|uniref:Uncharacterized protein n=1 Tax=Cupriavidus nantongensis TaxID=1796606 RepID=A0A142JKD3_9BURK|nr:hypothetical protein [Cupriavidus nantongensis]AMR78545.1 hypothetical protein A2G96_12790 [Cupriavidus nantongensis]